MIEKKVVAIIQSAIASLIRTLAQFSTARIHADSIENRGHRVSRHTHRSCAYVGVLIQSSNVGHSANRPRARSIEPSISGASAANCDSAFLQGSEVEDKVARYVFSRAAKRKSNFLCLCKGDWKMSRVIINSDVHGRLQVATLLFGQIYGHANLTRLQTYSTL